MALQIIIIIFSLTCIFALALCRTNTLCNRIQGATEGVVFPLNMNKDAVFRIWRKAFCRTFPIKYIGETVADNGLAAYKYTFTDDFLDTPETNPDNECYCRKMKKCLKKGLSDLTPCYYSEWLYCYDFFFTRLRFNCVVEPLYFYDKSE